MREAREYNEKKKQDYLNNLMLISEIEIKHSCFE